MTANGTLERKGVGGSLELDNPRRARGDLALVRRAIRQRWAIPEEVRSELPAAMRSIVNKESITVLNAQGEPVQIDNDRERIGAGRVLVAMEGQNQSDDHAEGGVEEKSATQSVVNLQVNIGFDKGG